MKPAQHPTALRTAQLLRDAGLDAGHAQPVKLLLDEGLRGFTVVWAAAGTPFAVFPLSNDQLQAVTGAAWVDLRH